MTRGIDPKARLLHSADFQKFSEAYFANSIQVDDSQA